MSDVIVEVDPPEGPPEGSSFARQALHKERTVKPFGGVRLMRAVGSHVEVEGVTGRFHIRRVAPAIARLRATRESRYARNHSYAVLPQAEPAAVDWSKGPVRVGGIEVEVDPLQGSLSIRTPGTEHRSPAGFVFGSDGSISLSLSLLPQEQVLGLGEKTGPLDRRGRYWEMWNTDASPHTESTDPLYVSIPFAILEHQGRCVGLFLDNPGRTWFDLGFTDPDLATLETETGEFDLYVIEGPGMKQVVARYSALTGRIGMPPRWAFGYQQCRWSYYPESQVRELAESFRKHRFPCDALYLDIHWMDRYRDFEWHPERFPDPAKLVSDLQRDGFQTVVIMDAGVARRDSYRVYVEGREKGYFVRMPDGEPFVGKVWPGVCEFPDFTRPAVREWWGGLHRSLVDVGVAGIWDDMDEPAIFDTPGRTMALDAINDDEGEPKPHAAVHNVYGMQMARATGEGLRRLAPDRRMLTITRAAYAGVQRYSMVWTGDNHSWWSHIWQAVPMCISLGLCGVPFNGPDAGGFGANATPEMFARWLQSAIFFPFLRAHSAWNTRRQEPWSFGEATLALCREAVEWRYRLIPYLYTRCEEAMQTGIPMMRPMAMEFPGCDVGDQFMCGPALLVAPIAQPRQQARQVVLPPGLWYDFWTDAAVEGGQTIAAFAPPNRIPVFVREGSAVPLGPVMQHTGEKPLDPVTWKVYPGPRGASGELYEDDGISYGYERGAYARSRLDVHQGVLTLHAREGGYAIPPRHTIVRFPSGVELHFQDTGRTTRSYKIP
ncbi:MAG: glycoside hydrolase family 31 protein [Candidatus Xenobia bacterium]